MNQLETVSGCRNIKMKPQFCGGREGVTWVGHEVVGFSTYILKALKCKPLGACVARQVMVL